MIPLPQKNPVLYDVFERLNGLLETVKDNPNRYDLNAVGDAFRSPMRCLSLKEQTGISIFYHGFHKCVEEELILNHRDYNGPPVTEELIHKTMRAYLNNPATHQMYKEYVISRIILYPPEVLQEIANKSGDIQFIDDLMNRIIVDGDFSYEDSIRILGRYLKDVENVYGKEKIPFAAPITITPVVPGTSSDDDSSGDDA